MYVYKILLHVSGISIVEILFYFYYIGPLETEIFTKEFGKLIRSVDNDFKQNTFYTFYQENYNGIYPYNESVKEAFIYEQNKTLENMKDSVDDSIKENEEYNNNLLKTTIIFWVAFNFIILLVYLLELNINYICKKSNNNTRDNSTNTNITTNTMITSNSNIPRELSNDDIELIRLNKNRAGSIDEEDLTYINNLHNSNSYVSYINNCNDSQNKDDKDKNKKIIKYKYVKKISEYLALAGSIILFQYFFINHIVLKYHILALGEIKYMLYKQLFPIINQILFPNQN
jgi:hypothetical protein